MNSSDEAAEALATKLAKSPRVAGSTRRPVIALILREAWPEIAAAVRAEAVADERRRIVKQVRAAKDEQVRAFGRDPGAYFAGRVDGLEDAARVVAAGSVPVATPPAEPAARVTRESIQRLADAILAEPFRPAPSQPVTCAHWKTESHVIDLAWPHKVWCPGPVSVPKENSE